MRETSLHRATTCPLSISSQQAAALCWCHLPARAPMLSLACTDAQTLKLWDADCDICRQALRQCRPHRCSATAVASQRASTVQEVIPLGLQQHCASPRKGNEPRTCSSSAAACTAYRKAACSIDIATSYSSPAGSSSVTWVECQRAPFCLWGRHFALEGGDTHITH